VRKPQAGCCGFCGCAVVKPSAQEKLIALDRRFETTAWASGHEFDERGNLVSVRCHQHGGEGFNDGQDRDWDGTVMM
jgi:hypothetical protein